MSESSLNGLDGDGIAAAAGRYPGFTSFKTITPIHYSKRRFRDPLVLATLDPAIQTLERAPSVLHPLPHGIEFAFCVVEAGHPRIVALSEVRTVQALPSSWRDARLLTRSMIATEPAASSARSIWSESRRSVPIHDRYRAIALVTRTSTATLRDVVAALDPPETTALLRVLALIATGYLSIDISDGIQPATRLTLGRMTQGSRAAPAIGDLGLDPV